MRVWKSAGFLLAVMLVLSLWPSAASAAYFPKQHERSNYASNIALIYTGYYNPANYDGVRIGDFDKDQFLPYVGYLNAEGKSEDYFFDTFLMLTTGSPHKGSLARYYDWVAGSKPGTLADWQWAMDRVFEEDLQLDGLEQAVEQVSADLNDSGKKVNVYLTLPFPDPQSRDFGDFNGDGTVKDLQSLDTRKELIKWYIDAMSARFEQKQYKHLSLSGFYWLQEDLDTTVPGEQESVQYASAYLNGMNMRLGWIPWSGAGEKANGSRLGFDFSLIQPNHYFDRNSTVKRVEETAELAEVSGAGVEIEFDQTVLVNPWYRQALYNYLIAGVKKGYMNNSILAYYQDVYAIHDFYHHKSSFGRQLYEDIYKFAKGTFQAPKGSFEGRVLDGQGAPIAGAALKDDNGAIAVTDVNGRFVIPDLFAVQHTYTVGKSGYSTRQIAVDIPQGYPVYRDIVLQNPDEGTLKESFQLADFEGGMIYGTNNGYYVQRSMTKDPIVVTEGSQSLKVDFKAYPDSWVGLYIDSDYTGFADVEHYPAYALKDWSSYDFVSTAVYNPSDQPQELRFVYMYEYSWAKTVVKDIELAPHQWTVVKQPIDELKQSGANTGNMIRVALMRNKQTEDATFYVDDMKLLKYEGLEPVPDYTIQWPNGIPSLDPGKVWSPVIVNNSTGSPVEAADVRFTSSDPHVMELLDDGAFKAGEPGKAVIRAFVGNVEASSTVMEVSPWTVNELNGGNFKVDLSAEKTVRLASSFDNGYMVQAQEASYVWEITGDAAQRVRAEGNSLTIKGVKEGRAVIKVTMTYNGKSRSLEKIIQVGNPAPRIADLMQNVDRYFASGDMNASFKEKLQRDLKRAGKHWAKGKTKQTVKAVLDFIKTVNNPSKKDEMTGRAKAALIADANAFIQYWSEQVE
ncbi:DUF4855 domain-containing protein [Paenibacillus spongiae]|uniref:DUF4855 domain-containing protein n=1 Tax=Paenibacillus spongiae TaxID=2909671 RepID=A0ABY5SEA1_9BACL|nr:DUF4855 domain-containing protein [Paenibacillus spongiae]UVI31820.1 DUF4855 domain-containing protein [Paenibacillus spongiae]